MASNEINSSVNYPCEYCDKTLSTLSNRNLHHRIHLGDKRYKCKYCGKRFMQQSALKIHERTHTGYRPFVCVFCEKGFPAKTGLKIHLRTHIQEKPNECTTCDRAFADHSALKRHVQGHTGSHPDRYTCGYCNKKFHHKGHYEIHLRVHTKEKPFRCEICPDKFYTQKGHVTNHMRTFHQGEKPFECRFCPKRYGTNTLLNFHVTNQHTHANEKNFKCDVCSEAFKYVNTLQRHKLRVHQGNLKLYKCPECGKSFNDKTYVNQHIKRVHQGIRNHVCAICGKTYASKGLLNTHIRRHLGELYWKCGVCGKGFTCKPDMERHALKHTNLKRYECLFCDGKWKKKRSHDMHIRRHLEEKVVFYRKCGYESFTIGNRKRHLLYVHGEGQERDCPLCDKKFFDEKTVRQHLKQVHYNSSRKINPHEALQLKGKGTECIFCGEMYANKANYQNHIRKHLEEKVVFCKTCGLETNSWEMRERHLINEHGKETQHSCSVCGRYFIDNRTLQRHSKEIRCKKN